MLVIPEHRGLCFIGSDNNRRRFIETESVQWPLPDSYFVAYRHQFMQRLIIDFSSRFQINSASFTR